MGLDEENQPRVTRVPLVAHRLHHRVTFAVLTVSAVAFALLQSLVVPVLTEIQTQLDTDQSTVTWVLTAYLLSASVCTPIVGRIGDRVGKQRALVATLVALSVGSLLAALSPSIGVMICARVIQGAGGGVLPLAFGIIRDEFPATRVSGAVGVIASLTAVGTGAGTVLGGPIVEGLGYPWLFLLPMIVTALAAVCAFAFVPESPVRTNGKISVLPALMLSGWLVALLLAVSRGPQWGWTSGRVLGLSLAALILAGAWVITELRSASPLIDMNMMRLPAVWTTNTVALLLGFAMYALVGFLPQFAQTPTSAGYGFGASTTESGLMLLPWSVTMFAVGLWSSHVVRVIGSSAVIVIGCLVVAASMAMVGLAHDHRWEVYVSNAIMGAGIGLVFSCMANLIVAAVPPEQTGVASGMNANIRTIGGSIGVAVMASIVTADAQPDGGVPSEFAYTVGFLTLAVVMVVAAGLGLLIPRLDRDEVEQHLACETLHPQSGLVAGGTLVGDKSE